MYSKSSLFFLANLITCILAAQLNTITLYDQCNYNGKKYQLGVGNHSGYAMMIGNDKLSSFKIPSGMKLTIYEHDKFQGRSITYSSSLTCLPADWDNNASSLVVESQYDNNNSNSDDYVVFYNDCYSKGYSQSLRPGSYSGNQLGSLYKNISSFTVYGNLRVKVYINSDNLAGYSYMHEASVSCLNSNQNDKIASLVIEYKPYTPSYPNNQPNYGNQSYATVYTNCNYGGNSLRLGPGFYQGDKLGLFRYDISSIEIPTNLRAKVFINNENLGGTSYFITQNINCLSANLNNRIGSLLIEEIGGSYNPGNNNYPGGNNQKVVLYADVNYEGQAVALLPGSYATMPQVGFENDVLSSLTVPQGYRVVLYEHENFGGKSFTVSASRASFSLTGWNDRASSLRVYRDY